MYIKKPGYINVKIGQRIIKEIFNFPPFCLLNEEIPKSREIHLTPLECLKNIF